MKLGVSFLGADRAWRGRKALLRAALKAAAAHEARGGAVCVLLGDDAALRALNRDWRGKDRPTNVLSFPSANPDYLGDIALSHETIAREADAQGKSFEAHAAHLAVHGYLHLIGYDHEREDEAEIMEARERAILAILGIADPYIDERTADTPAARR